MRNYCNTTQIMEYFLIYIIGNNLALQTIFLTISLKKYVTQQCISEFMFSAVVESNEIVFFARKNCSKHCFCNILLLF